MAISNAYKLLAASAAESIKDHCKNILEGKGTVHLTIEEGAITVEIPRSSLKSLLEALESMSENGSQYLTTQEVADTIGASRPYIVKLLEKGEIPFVKIGRHRRVKKVDLNSYIARLENES